MHDKQHGCEVCHQRQQKSHTKHLEYDCQVHRRINFRNIVGCSAEHILKRIFLAGSILYGNVNRKKKKEDGTYYKDYFFYACKHRKKIDGVRCYYDKQWNEKTINGAVEETIRRVVRNPEFEAALRKKIDSRVDT